MDGAEVINRDERPPAPVVFRAPRQRVLRRLVYAVALAVLAGLCWSVLHIIWLATVATVACLVQFAAAARAAAGTVSVDQDGVRVRTLTATHQLPWAEITGCEVRARVLGRSVRLTRTVPHRRVKLPAPASPYLIPDPAFDAEVQTLREVLTAHHRASSPGTEAPGAKSTKTPGSKTPGAKSTRTPGGRTAGADRPDADPPAFITEGTANPRRYWVAIAAIVAAALLLDQPWGWPAGPQAVAVPDPCAVAAGHLTGMVGDRKGEAGSSRPASATTVAWCSWDLGGSPDRFVTVEIQRYDRLGLHAGTSRAKTNFSTASRALAGVAVDSAPRLGDESVLVEGDVAAGVVARRGNVLAWIVARGPVPGYNRADVLAVERTIVDGIKLG